jgi:hypothetical protein
LRRRDQTGCQQYLADRRRRDGDPDALELANDPPVSPVRVLVGEPQDLRSQRHLERRPAGLSVRIRPAASDKLVVPTQQRLRLDREARPGRPRQRAAQRRQQPRSARVSAGRACRRRTASS